MNLVPRALVVGAFLPPPAPGQAPLSTDAINQVWSELSGPHSFVRLEMGPPVQFHGATADDGVIIQPPLVQVRSRITTTAGVAADSAQAVIAAIAGQAGAAHIFNIGIRHVYMASLPDNDARDFVLRRVLSQDDDRLADLTADSVGFWGGAKFVIGFPDRQYKLTVEPAQSDAMRSIFIDLDAQFPGLFAPDAITERAREACDFVTSTVNRYLDDLT